MLLNEAINSFIDGIDRNSLSAACGIFGLTVNEVISLTGRERRTLHNWSQNDRELLLTVLIGCNKLLKE